MSALLVYAVGVAAMAAIARRPSGDAVDFSVALASTFAVGLGLLVAWRRPESPMSGALVFLVAAPTLVAALEAWGATNGTPGQMPAASVVAAIAPGVWVFNLAGFVVLCATVPNGPATGWGGRRLPGVYLAAALFAMVVVSIQPEADDRGGATTSAPAAMDLPAPLNTALILAAALALFASLAAAALSVVVRYRAGDELTRVQLRWFTLGCVLVPVLLVGGWIAEALGAALVVAYTPFMVAIVVGLPITVAVAIFRHDLLDIDRVLSDTLSWLLTTVVAAAVFALVVTAISQSGVSRDLVGEGGGLVVAAFVTALILTPLHRWFAHVVGSLVDRDRVVVLAAVRRFIDRVRDGQAEPEEVETVLRECLDDPALRVLLREPGHEALTGLDGTPQAPDPNTTTIELESRGATVGALLLGRTSAGRVRRAREAAAEARLAIEVSRLRMELRHSLDDARMSRLRLVEAATTERRRLERDLHDGAQQQIVAVGMRLRSIQHQRPPGDPVNEELDLAVNSLEAIVDELRRLAHGMRPSMLDDGLGAALRLMVTDSPIPVHLDVAEVRASEAAVTTAYFVVAEALANALKHSGATNVDVHISAVDDRLGVAVCDDGTGGARPGFGLTAIRDRVAALGGTFTMASTPTEGTRIEVLL